MLLKHIRFCMKMVPKHVPELFRHAVRELSRSI